MDVWIEISKRNAAKMVEVLVEFGFGVPELSETLFLTKGRADEIRRKA